MSLNTTPRDWAAGEIVTAGNLNTEIRDAIAGLQAAWTAFSPGSASGFTLGNGTLEAAYSRIGKTISIRIRLTLGSTSSIASNVAFTIPFTPIAVDQTISGALNDVSGGTGGRLTATGFIPASTAQVQVWSHAGSLTSTVPFTWATGDKIVLTGTYEAV